MPEINGTPGDDNIVGTPEDDVIRAGAGNDTIDGAAGNDTIYDEDGNDTVNGGDGDDTFIIGRGDDIVRGGAGNDRFVQPFGAFGGSDQLYGEGGNDHFSVNAFNGSILLDGGIGNDTMILGLLGTFTHNIFTAVAGSGDDTLFVGQGGGSIVRTFGQPHPNLTPEFYNPNQINLGSGNDRISLSGGISSVTLGAGVDTLRFGHDLAGVSFQAAPYTVLSDYTPGVDRIDYLRFNLTNWDGSNPFSTGHVRLVQENGDTYLQVDTDGGGDNYWDMIRFVGVSMASLTAADLGGYNPTGAASVGVMITGTEGNDLSTIDNAFFPVGGLIGTPGNDTVRGLGGNDFIATYDGNDTIYGDDGDDRIESGFGNDIVSGGAGDDSIFDRGGSDTIDAGTGNDSILLGLATTGHTTAHGGEGADRFTVLFQETFGQPRGSATLHGDAGDDAFGFFQFSFLDPSAFRPVIIEVFGGTGNDEVGVGSAQYDITATLGEGADRINLSGFTPGDRSVMTVTDFDASVDTIVLGDFGFFGGLTNTAGVTNLFASGHVRIVQDGANTLLQFDADGGGTQFVTAVTFLNIAPSAFTAANFTWTDGGGQAKTMAPNTDFRNWIFGTAQADTLIGTSGPDTLTGRAGNDQIDGGSNVDTAVVSGNRAAYSITETSTGVFRVQGPDGTDTLTRVEFLRFDDQTLRLLPGTGVTVNFDTADPTTYQSAMQAIRDFDGNALGGNGSWLRIGSADVNGDGDIDQILVNDAIGRFATVGTAPDGLTYFSDFSWAGETRVAGIYIDPLVQSGDVVAGSDNDSQRRFQNDLQIENINRVLGADDYDGDGIWEVYFALTDGTAYLRALMHEDGNIRYANYQSEQEVIDYLTANGYDESTFGDWFPSGSTSASDTLTFVNRTNKAGPADGFEMAPSLHMQFTDEIPSEFYG